jgi:ferric-dicitrate binding protein FerR (iron transport regulator)
VSSTYDPKAEIAAFLRRQEEDRASFEETQRLMREITRIRLERELRELREEEARGSRRRVAGLPWPEFFFGAACSLVVALVAGIVSYAAVMFAARQAGLWP